MSPEWVSLEYRCLKWTFHCTSLVRGVTDNGDSLLQNLFSDMEVCVLSCIVPYVLLSSVILNNISSFKRKVTAHFLANSSYSNFYDCI